jgi:hypothetical protein
MIAKKFFFLKFNFIFSRKDFEKFSLLRELQIFPWPIAPSNFSPLCPMPRAYHQLQSKHFTKLLVNFAKCKCPLHVTSTNFHYSGYIYYNFSSVLEFPRWWDLESKIFGQNQHTRGKMLSAVLCECQFVNKVLKELN